MHTTGDEAGEPNLVPLLDLVFQLIMFFMITVNFVRVDQINEEISLPMAQAAVPMEQTAEDFVFLNIDKNGRLVGTLEDLNGGRKLEEYLKGLMRNLVRKARMQGDKGDPKIVLVLRADKDARYKDVWDVMEIGKTAGIKHYQFRALKKQ
jgi:biopolymer transport protein ExbD